MAPVKEKRPVQTLQQALVELDKSTEGFAEQISKAYKIAGIALKDNSTLLWGLTTNVQLERSYALSAKEEWVLRWLLNRLQAKEEVGKNARSDPRSWLLLIRLLQQIPPANAARVLNTHKFLLILEQTSNEVRDLTGSLHDNCPVNGSLFHSPNQSEDSGTSALLDSSSTVVDSLSEDSLRKSRKRKRASRAAQHVQPRSSPAERRREFYTLLLSVLKAIGCIVRASGTSGTHKPAFACEYMKSVLRTDAKAAARIVGRLLSSGSFVLQEIDHRSMTFEHNGSWAGALLEIWNNRAVTADDTLGESSNAAFSSECLSSIALLLSRYRSLITQSSATKDTIRILEKLLARHLFIPARSAFFTPLFSKSQSLSETRRGEPKLLIDLLKPLREKNIAAQAQVDDTKYSEQPAGDLSSAIPFLLDIAIRCSPSSSPRKRLAERPWLQALFLGLLETADISTSPTSGQAKQQSRVLMLDQVLDVCIKREVSLKTDTLKTIMYQWSGLLEESGPVNWSLVGKLLKLDTNVFLPPKNKSGDTNEQGSADTDQLKLLLSKITGAITRDHSNFSKDYLIVKAQIIQPLMLGFSRARDLSGFLELWRGGLMVFEEQYAAGKHEGGNALSVWQDEDLSLWLREDLENSMTGGQIVQALFSAHHQLQSLLKIGPSALELPRKLGSSVIIDATLGAVAQEHTFDMLQNETLQVHLTVSGALLNTQYGAAHRWHLWRILARIYEHLPWAQILHSAKENGAEASLSDAKDLVNEAKITVQRAMPNAAKEIIMPHAADALEALHFLLAFNMSLTESSALMPLARDAMSEILEAATRMLSSNVPCPWSPSPTWGKDKVRSWGGDPENIPTLSNGGLLVPTMLLFYQFRRILSVSPSDVRRRLFRTLYWAAYWEDRLKLEDKREESLVREAQMASAWQALLADEYFLNDVSSKDHLLSTLRAGLSLSGNEQEDWIYKDETDPVNDGDVKSFAENNREEFNDFTIRCYLDLPLKVIHRQHREDVLDRLYQRTTDPAVRLSPSQLSNHVALMVRLMDLPNASSKFAMDPDTLWHMAKVQTSNYINNYQDEVNCKNFETLVRRTLTHLINTKEQDRSQHYLTAFQKTLQRFIEDSVQRGGSLFNCWKFGIIKASVSVFWHHRNTLATMSTGVDMNLLRHQCLRSLIRLLGEWEENLLALDRILDAMTVILDPWGEMDDGARSAMERIASLLMMRWKNGTWNQGSEGLRMLPIWPSLVVPTYKLTATIPNFRDSSNMQTLAFSLLDLDIMRDPGAVGFTSAWRRSILSTFKQSMQSSDGQEKLNTLSELGLTAFDNEASISRLQLLGVLVATIDDTGNMPIELRRKLSNTFVKLCDYLPGANLVSRFSLTINIMEMMMRKKSWVITQWSIDNALQSIAICCSPTGPKFETPSSGSVFLDLTRLLGNILAVHRQKLGGRFHLVILVMQGLLRCLFAPLNRGIVRLSNTTGRPPWLESKSANLGAEEAGAYSKLLTTLCDPTVSSVTSSRNRLKNELSDETKKAKAIVGQYLPYVLMEYTQCQLRFRMPPEVKAALMPGLHAVFDVMAQDTMRTLNAAMDSSNRAIFKDLYNDYRRFGKWKEK